MKDGREYTVIVRFTDRSGQKKAVMFAGSELTDGGSEQEMIRAAWEKTAAFAGTARVLSADIHTATDNEIKAFQNRKAQSELRTAEEFFRNFNRTADIDLIRSRLEESCEAFCILQRDIDEAVSLAEEKSPGSSLAEKLNELIRYYATYAAAIHPDLIPNGKNSRMRR